MSDTRAELLIREEANGEWQVWIGADGEHPVNSPLGFIIGVGDSRDEALASAVACLEASVDALQSPPGVVPHEREVTRTASNCGFAYIESEYVVVAPE